MQNSNTHVTHSLTAIRERSERSAIGGAVGQPIYVAVGDWKGDGSTFNIYSY